MFKKYWFVIAFLVGLALAQLDLFLWASFRAGKWAFAYDNYYSMGSPSSTVTFLMHGIALASVVMLAVTIKLKMQGNVRSFVYASVWGVLFVPGIVILALSLTTNNYQFENLFHAFWYYAGFVMSFPPMFAHVITAVIAAGLGVVLANRIATITLNQSKLAKLPSDA